METLSTILSPIVWVMSLILNQLISLTNSVGVSILLLSLFFSFILIPVRKAAVVVEKRIGDRMNAAATEVAIAKQTLKGEKLFLETEKIYNQLGYHPIQNVALGTSFLVMLPILLSAIVLFSDNPATAGQPFLFIKDLQQADHLFGPVNVLPIVMSGVTILDAHFRFADDRSAKIKFYILAAVLLLLVYNLASGLVLYWTGSNLFSLLLAMLVEKKKPA